MQYVWILSLLIWKIWIIYFTCQFLKWGFKIFIEVITNLKFLFLSYHASKASLDFFGNIPKSYYVSNFLLSPCDMIIIIMKDWQFYIFHPGKIKCNNNKKWNDWKILEVDRRVLTFPNSRASKSILNFILFCKKKAFPRVNNCFQYLLKSLKFCDLKRFEIIFIHGKLHYLLCITFVMTPFPFKNNVKLF